MLENTQITSYYGVEFKVSVRHAFINALKEILAYFEVLLTSVYSNLTKVESSPTIMVAARKVH